MKTKTMQNVIKKHFENFLSSIHDKKVKDLVAKNTILAGGSIASMFLREDINDFDFYFRDKQTALAILEYYLGGAGIDKNIIRETDDRIKLFIVSAGIIKIKPVKDKKFQPLVFTDNAITLTDKTQLILRFYGEPDEILKNYDFSHVTNYWTSWDQKIVTNQKALECLLTKELIYQGSLYPLASLFRIRKFMKRGWSITAGTILKIALQISKLDLMDFKVFQEQLVGVDVSYFSSMIQLLKVEYEDKGQLDINYIIELIDDILMSE